MHTAAEQSQVHLKERHAAAIAYSRPIWDYTL